MQLNDREKKVMKVLGALVGLTVAGAILGFAMPKLLHFLLHVLVMDVVIVLEGLVIATTAGLFAAVATWLTWKMFFAIKQKCMTPHADVIEKLEEKFHRDATNPDAEWKEAHLRFAQTAAHIGGKRIGGIVAMFVAYAALFGLVFTVLALANVLR